MILIKSLFFRSNHFNAIINLWPLPCRAIVYACMSCFCMQSCMRQSVCVWILNELTNVFSIAKYMLWLDDFISYHITTQFEFRLSSFYLRSSSMFVLSVLSVTFNHCYVSVAGLFIRDNVTLYNLYVYTHVLYSNMYKRIMKISLEFILSAAYCRFSPLSRISQNKLNN